VTVGVVAYSGTVLTLFPERVAAFRRTLRDVL